MIMKSLVIQPKLFIVQSHFDFLMLVQFANKCFEQESIQYPGNDL